jgi:glycine/serine hydroxymethyltransferase
MGRVLNNMDRPEVQKEVEKEVKALTNQFPLYAQRLELAQKLD